MRNESLLSAAGSSKKSGLLISKALNVIRRFEVDNGIVFSTIATARDLLIRIRVSGFLMVFPHTGIDLTGIES